MCRWRGRFINHSVTADCASKSRLVRGHPRYALGPTGYPFRDGLRTGGHGPSPRSSSDRAEIESYSATSGTTQTKKNVSNGNQDVTVESSVECQGNSTKKQELRTNPDMNSIPSDEAAYFIHRGPADAGEPRTARF